MTQRPAHFSPKWEEFITSPLRRPACKTSNKLPFFLTGSMFRTCVHACRAGILAARGFQATAASPRYTCCWKWHLGLIWTRGLFEGGSVGSLRERWKLTAAAFRQQLVSLNNVEIWTWFLLCLWEQMIFVLIDNGSSLPATNSHRLRLFFADQSCRDGRAVPVPQQPPERRRSGWGARTPGRHQVRLAQETRGLRQDVAQSLVRSARGSAVLFQRWGGNQASGKTEIPSATMQPHTGRNETLKSNLLSVNSRSWFRLYIQNHLIMQFEPHEWL